jgi:hypothetical protein
MIEPRASEAAPLEGQIIIYRDGALKLQVRLDAQTVWLTQAGIAELFQTTPQNITIHIKSIYADGEQDEEATCKDYLQVRTEGGRRIKRELKHYNLDIILAVGYRVRSHRGTQFRQWATARLSELLVKGFTLDDERIKAGRTIGQDYFDELLQRIRDIRASERLFYQKITDIYASSIDYDPRVEISQTFFATVQNKLHWAIHGHTAAEIIAGRADAAKANMGLTTWKNAPDGLIRKADVTVAKNYLNEEEIKELNRIVTMYLDYAEDQARRKRPMHMRDWIAKLDAFLQFNERNILTHAGTISHQLAIEHAEGEFEKHRADQRRLEAELPVSDFDKIVEEVKQIEKKPPKDQTGAPAERTGQSSKRKKKGRPNA